MTSQVLGGNKYRMPQWKISVTASLIVHVLLGLLILLYPADKRERTSLFNARLITPEELKQWHSPTPSARPPQSLPFKQTKPASPHILKPVAPQKETHAGRSIPVPTGSGMNGELPAGQKGAAVPPAGLPPAAGSQGAERVAPSVPLREKLFDREIIQRFAQREDAQKDTGVTFDTSEFRYRAYMARLKEKIESVWKYPPDAAMHGIYGDLRIRFTIKKNGMLGSVELERTSGHKELDEAAMQALKDAEPFWPLPEEWDKEALTIPGHFVYSIYGTYIR